MIARTSVVIISAIRSALHPFLEAITQLCFDRAASVSSLLSTRGNARAQRRSQDRAALSHRKCVHASANTKCDQRRNACQRAQVTDHSPPRQIA